MECPTDAEIEQHIADLFSNYEDDSEITEYIENHEELYSEDIHDFAFREAIRQGVAAYIEEHAEEFDLNDDGGSSSYLYETDDEDIQELLMDMDAFRSWEDYDDCRFAVETVNGSILAFNADFQREAYITKIGNCTSCFYSSVVFCLEYNNVTITYKCHDNP